MMNFIKSYWIAIIIFLAIDILWLSVIAKQLYLNEIGSLLAKKPNLIVAIIFYIIFVNGLVYFAILPALQTSSLKLLLINSALYGLMTYATYDLTALSIIKNWPLWLSIIDILWGIAISILTSLLTYQIIKILGV